MLSFFSSRQNWDSPNPSSAGKCAPPPPHPPPPLGSGGRGTLAGERGVGRAPIPTSGHTLRYPLYIRTLWRKFNVICKLKGRSLKKSLKVYRPFASLPGTLYHIYTRINSIQKLASLKYKIIGACTVQVHFFKKAPILKRSQRPNPKSLTGG